MRAAVYARQSLLKERKAESVERQLSTCRHLAAGRGYEVVAEFSDEGVSAYDGSRRPGFDGLTDAVAAGKVDVVVAVHPDRLWRQPLDRIGFMAVAKAAGLNAVVTAQGGEESIGQADDEFTGDLLAILAKRESATIGRRMRAKHDAKRAAGQWPGGPAPFGYRLDPANKSLVVVEDEAAVIRDVVRMLLGGVSLVNTAAHWSKRAGRLITPSTASKLLLSPTYAGRRRDGSPASWPAVVAAEDHEAVTALFAARTRGRRGPRGRHRLSGGLRCSECNTGMTAVNKRGELHWRCSAPNGGCGAVQVSNDLAEESVIHQLAEMVDGPVFAAAIVRSLDDAPEVGDIARELSAARERLQTLGEMLADGTLPPDEYKRLTGRLRTRTAELENDLAMASRSTSTDALADLPGSGAALRQAWPDATPEEGQRLVAILAGRITVSPRVVGGPRRQLDRVEVASRW